MLENKFKTYSSLSLYSAIITVIITTLFYAVDCAESHSAYAGSFMYRMGFFAIAVILFVVYQRQKDYRIKRFILALMPHLAFMCCFLSHIATGKTNTISLSLMMLMFGFLSSNFPLRLRDVITSSITYAFEIALALVFTTPEHTGISAVFVYTALAITTVLSFYIDLNYRKQYEAEEKVKTLSETDALTQCLNRKCMSGMMYEGSNRLRTKKPVTILMLDIDHFKNVNDTYGHEMGDEVLKYIASTVRSCIRGEDILIRWGGEEFVILLNGITPEDAVPIAERIRLAVSEGRPETVSQDIPTTISIGVAGYDRKSFDLSLKRADERLYAAKNSGRNQVCFA